MKTQMLIATAMALLSPILADAGTNGCRVKEVSENKFVIGFKIEGADARKLYESLPVEARRSEGYCDSEGGCASPREYYFYKTVQVDNGSTPRGLRASLGVQCRQQMDVFSCSVSGNSYTTLNDLLSQRSSPERATKLFFEEFNGTALDYATANGGFTLQVNQIGGNERIPVAEAVIDFSALACRLEN